MNQAFSISKLKLFQTCPHRYYLKYILNTPEPSIGNALILGTAVHATIEKYSLVKGELDPSKYLKDTYDALKFKHEQAGKPIIYGDWDTYTDDIARGQEIVTKFLGKSVTHQTKRIYSEIPFCVEFPGLPDTQFVGVIDGITEDGQVLEYKTTKAEVQPFFIENDIQMAMYAYALKYGRSVEGPYLNSKPNHEFDHLFGKMPRIVTYVALHSLCKGKKPWHVQQLYHEMVPTEEHLTNLVKTVSDLVAMISFCQNNNIWIKNLKDATTTPCNLCPYQQTCWTKSQEPAIDLESELEQYFK